MNTHHNREEFRFRLEKSSEIIKCLHELGINISENDILFPEKSKEQCQSMYEQLAELCTGVTREEMFQPSLRNDINIIYPELHEDSLMNLNAFRACSKMMEACGIYNFTIKDFITPDSKRTRRFLSGVINFLKFREERLGLLSDLNSSRDGLLEKMSSLRQRGDAASMRLGKLREQTADDTRLVCRIEDEIKDIENQIATLGQQQVDAKDELISLKSRNDLLKDELTQRMATLEMLLATKKSLSMQVVSNPERFRKQISDSEVALKNEQVETKKAERKARDLSAWTTSVEDAQIEVTAALDALADLQNEVERQRTVMTELDTVRQQTEGKLQALGDIEQEMHQTNRSVGRTDEKLTHLRRQATSRASEGKKVIADLHSELRKTEASTHQARDKAELYENEAIKLERENMAEQNAFDEEINDMVGSYKRLENLVLDHLRSLTQAIQVDLPHNSV